MPSTRVSPVAPVVAVLLLAACGGPAASDPLMMTCDVRTGSGTYAGQCIEWHGDVTHSTNANVTMSSVCGSSYSGTSLQGACPAESVVGTCAKTPSVAKRLVLTSYYSPTFATASAQTNCQGQGGAFTAR